MDVTKVQAAIDQAQAELNTLIDATYSEAKKSGKGFDRLKTLGQVARNLESAAKNLVKSATVKAAPAAKQ